MATSSRRGNRKLDYLVVQDNDIIQKSQHALTEQQQNILLSMIAEVGIEDTPDTIYTFSIKEFAEVMNLNMDGGVYYTSIKNDIDTIDRQRMWLLDKYNPSKRTRLQWLRVLRIDDSSGIVEYNFHEDIRPFIFQLQERFTKFKLKYAVALSGRYAKKLYALLKSYENMETVIELEIDRLRILLDAETYTRYVDFKRFVIDSSVEEINKYTDIEVEVEKGRVEGRAVKSLKFEINPLNDWVFDRFEYERRQKKLNKKLGLEDK